MGGWGGGGGGETKGKEMKGEGDGSTRRRVTAGVLTESGWGVGVEYIYFVLISAFSSIKSRLLNEVYYGERCIRVFFRRGGGG